MLMNGSTLWADSQVDFVFKLFAPFPVKFCIGLWPPTLFHPGLDLGRQGERAMVDCRSHFVLRDSRGEAVCRPLWFV